MTSQALCQIEAQIHALVEAATPEQPVDTHELHLIGVRVGAQAEMIEKGLAE